MTREPGVTPTDHAPLTGAAVDATDKTVTELWTALLDEAPLQEAFVQAVRALARDETTSGLYGELEARDVPSILHGLVVNVAKGWKRSAWGLLARARGLADSNVSNDFAGVQEILATASLFDALEADVTLAVRIDGEFRDRRRDQREDILELVALLAKGIDVRLVCSGYTRRWLADVHREDVPGVTDWCNAHPDRGPTGDVADAALAELDPDGRGVRILQYLADEPGETLSYSALYAQATVGEARVRQLVGTLSDLEVVETYGPASDRRVELLEAGRSVLQSLETETARQQSISEAVRKSGKSHTQAVVSQQGREGGEGDDVAADHVPYRTRFAPRSLEIAASAAAADAGVSLLEERSPTRESREVQRTKFVEFDAGRGEALVSVRASGGLQYLVSLASALASPQLLGKIPESRFEEIDEPAWLLRGARCIGSLSDEALDDPVELRRGLVEWGELLEDMTTEMQRGECEDRERFRGEIMRSAHGLAGSVAHLLDAMEIDVVRDVRVPRGRDASHLEELAKSVAISAAIQSRYGSYASYRQLFETDAGKPNLSPTVDASDPAASLLGGFVIRGADVERLREPLLDYIDAPGEFQEDATEFVVRVPIREPDRSEYADAVGRVLSWKNLTPSREHVSLLHSLAPSPFAACEALMRGLAKESFPDDLRADEVRVALASLEADEILPDLPPTVGKAVSALLETTERVSQRDLADRADVSPRSIRNHRDRLEALGLLDVTDAGWRLTLAFPTQSERRATVVPASVTRRFVDVVADVLEVALPPDRYADPDDPVASAVFWPPDPWGLVDMRRSITPWVALAARLAGAERPIDEAATVEMGPEIEQTPLVEATPDAAASP